MMKRNYLIQLIVITMLMHSVGTVVVNNSNVFFEPATFIDTTSTEPYNSLNFDDSDDDQALSFSLFLIKPNSVGKSHLNQPMCCHSLFQPKTLIRGPPTYFNSL